MELQAEVRVLPRFGLALIGGYGSVTVEDPTSSADPTFTAYEIGGQIVGYPIEDFESLQLGAEILWIRVETEDYEDVSGFGAGLALGPLVGYKLITRAGFTFFVQGGFEYVTLRAEATNASGDTASADGREIIPLLNVNLGWSI